MHNLAILLKYNLPLKAKIALYSTT